MIEQYVTKPYLVLLICALMLKTVSVLLITETRHFSTVRKTPFNRQKPGHGGEQASAETILGLERGMVGKYGKRKRDWIQTTTTRMARTTRTATAVTFTVTVC